MSEGVTSCSSCEIASMPATATSGSTSESSEFSSRRSAARTLLTSGSEFIRPHAIMTLTLLCRHTGPCRMAVIGPRPRIG